MDMIDLDKSNVYSVSVVMRFNEALNARDVDGMMRLMTDDCVFENTYPAPDGTRYTGQAQVRTFWDSSFQTSRYARIEVELIFGMGVRCVMLWKYHWVNGDGEQGNIRGVDIYSLEGGLIAEKLSYVKG